MAALFHVIGNFEEISYDMKNGMRTNKQGRCRKKRASLIRRGNKVYINLFIRIGYRKDRDNMSPKKVKQERQKIDAPIKKDEIVSLKIEHIGSEGEGIGKYEGYTLFVKDAVAGDEVKVKVIKTKKNYGYARLLEILKPSADRVMPKCEVARQCGGCQIQQVAYEKQLEYKQQKVKDCFTRIGGFENIVAAAEAGEDQAAVIMEPIIGMKDPFYYRNKSQFPVGRNKEGEIITGFYAGRTHSIISHDSCHIGATINEKILTVVKEFMSEFGIEPYNEETHSGLVRHVLTRIGFVTGEVMVCLIINGKKLLHVSELAERLSRITEEGIYTGEGIQCAKVRRVTSVCLNVNQEKTNVILGRQIIPVYGEPHIVDYIGDVKYQISPLSFYQVNPVQTKKLYDLTMEYASLTGNEVVWDLYCGIGTISLFLAQKAKQVYGVEIIPQAIEDAKHNAKLNKFTNTEFFVGAAEEVLPRKYKEENIYADVIVVDPPRKGCEESLLDTIVAMNPERVVYVSCDPATLARDAKYLGEKGYELVKFRPVDQFSHSTHVETVVLLSKGMVDSRKVKVDFSLEDMDLSEFKGKATYEQIKAYVLEQTGLKVSSLYIAQIKKKCGLDVGENFNLPKSENARQPKCTPEKEDAIMQAFRHFGII